jgi:hypothetical protein
VGKDISLDDTRLSLEKLPDRFVEHPASVIVFTNLYYREAPWLAPGDPAKARELNWKVVELDGGSAFEYGHQLGSLEEFLVDAWQAKASERTGNPLYVRPSVLVMYRQDHRFLLDSVIPRPEQNRADFDLAIASQPWRASMDAKFKARFVLSPLVRALAPCGRMMAVQSIGRDPGLEIIREVWPDEDPFRVDRQELLNALKKELGGNAADYDLDAIPDSEAIFPYKMHTLPEELEDSIGTSTLFAAWNAAIYVAQIDDQRLESVLSSTKYLEATAGVLHKYNGLWFNDESFTVTRRSA